MNGLPEPDLHKGQMPTRVDLVLNLDPVVFILLFICVDVLIFYFLFCFK